MLKKRYYPWPDKFPPVVVIYLDGSTEDEQTAPMTMVRKIYILTVFDMMGDV